MPGRGVPNRKGNGEPVRGTDGPVRGTEGPGRGTGPMLIAGNPGKVLIVSRTLSGRGFLVGAFIDTEYDRAKVPTHNGNDPRPPWVV